MSDQFEDIESNIADAIYSLRESPEDIDEAIDDEQSREEIVSLRQDIQTFLDEASNEEDKKLRQGVLVSAIESVSAELDVSIEEIIALFFSEEQVAGLQDTTAIREMVSLLFGKEQVALLGDEATLSKTTFGENLLFEHLLLLDMAERDPVLALYYADRYKDQPYAAKIIGTLAERDPKSALIYADRYKDQPYAAEVIGAAAERYPAYALVYPNRYKDQPYAAEIIGAAAEREPGVALEFADRYKDQSYAAEVIEKAAKTAAEREPFVALAYANRYKDQPYAAEVIGAAAERDPRNALYYADRYKDQPYAEEVIEKAARAAAERDPQSALAYADRYKDQPYAEEVIEKAARTAAEREPRDALYYADRYKYQPYAAEVIGKAAKASVFALYHEDDRRKVLLGNSEDKTVQDLVALVRRIRDEHIDPSVLYLSHYIVNNELSLEEAVAVTQDPAELMKNLMDLKNIPDAIGHYDIETGLRDICLKTVITVNDLHNEQDSVRFASVAHSSPEELYYLMTYGEEEVFTSSFNGFFDRIVERLKRSGQTGYDLLESTHGNKFRIFVKLCANYGRLGEFLETMESTQRTEVLERFVSDLEKSDDFLAEAVTVADAFASLEDPQLLTQVQETLKREYERVQREGSEEGIKIYGLLASMFGAEATIDVEWYSKMAEQYGMENVSRLPAEALFNPDGSNVQQHFFYGDKDGIASFDHFMQTYKSKEGWKVEDKDTFVVITKTSGSKKVIIYANKPQHETDGVQAIENELQEKKVERIVAVHRGHSYHAGKTIEKLTPSASIVFLGSCGGYNNVSRVLDKSKKAHILATKGTGTMLINDPLLLLLNETILVGEDIEWHAFWNKAESKLGSQKDFSGYVSPHENLGVLFLKAYAELDNR